MCKYCDDLKKDGEANLCASTNDMGVLGQADMVTRIVDYGYGRFVLKTSALPFTALTSLSYPFVRILFCPICGRKLVEE
nr:MAG TPA: Recombinase zinc beta ribbon domain [Bacteriophage sp.]